MMSRWSLSLFGLSLIGIAHTSLALEVILANESQKSAMVKIKPSRQVVLGEQLNEISGLASVDSLLWGINDSGNGPQLIPFSQDSGVIGQPLALANVYNTDWEELTQDDNFLYIADTGNNFAQRTELNIYKVPLNELREQKTLLSSERINIRYSDRTDVFPSRKHNFDSEALASVEGELWLFSKNRADQRTKFYKVDPNIAEQRLTPLASYPVGGLITAADYNSQRKQILLLGHTRTSRQSNSFIWQVNVKNGMLHWPSARKYRLSVEAQWESVLWQGNQTFVIAAEKSSWAGDAQIAQFELPTP